MDKKWTDARSYCRLALLIVYLIPQIIVSTLPPGASRWLKHDLPHRIEVEFGLPVTHLVGQPEPVARA